MFLTMFYKKQNIVLTMPLTVLIAHPYLQNSIVLWYTKLFMHTAAKISMVWNWRGKTVAVNVIIIWASLPSLACEGGGHILMSQESKQ